METPFIVLSMRFVPSVLDGGSWTLFDAEENDVGNVTGWIAEQLIAGDSGNVHQIDYTGKTEYAVVIEPVEP